MSGYFDTNFDYQIAEHDRRVEKVNSTAWMFEPESGHVKVTASERFAAATRRASLPVAAAASVIAALAMLVR
jgi:hypothetical protein